jgi:hypothetical protein
MGDAIDEASSTAESQVPETQAAAEEEMEFEEEARLVAVKKKQPEIVENSAATSPMSLPSDKPEDENSEDAAEEANEEERAFMPVFLVPEGELDESRPEPEHESPAAYVYRLDASRLIYSWDHAHAMNMVFQQTIHEFNLHVTKESKPTAQQAIAGMNEAGSKLRYI